MLLYYPCPLINAATGRGGELCENPNNSGTLNIGIEAFSNPRIPRPSVSNIRTGINELVGYYDALQEFDAFVAYLRFYAQAQRCAITRRDSLAVHGMCQDSLRMKGIKHINAFAILVETVKRYETGGG